MTDKRYIEIVTNPGTVKLEDIPVLEYTDFVTFLDLVMGEEGTHCVAYFVLPQPGYYRFICCMAADENHALLVFSHIQHIDPALSLPSITAKHFQFHVFEREMHENFGIDFAGHPWLKPVRYPFDRADQSQVMNNYPFYSIDGEQLHEVGVGPVHAGIIEPGHFRFICHGEQVLHLEIQLGYQHRAIERLFVERSGILQQSVLAESIAGDTVIGHALAYAAAIESLAGITVSKNLSVERIIALELERIAVHIGDTAALCTDIAYQFGQVVNEALRTIIINTTQLWCGNRFGKGLIRPGGSNYPLKPLVIGEVLKNLKEVEERYLQVTARIFSLPSVLGRFEGTGKVTTMQASLIGAVGMAAKSSGMYRDIRWSHPFSAYGDLLYEPVMLHKGDVWSRAMLRKKEVEKSMAVIRELLKEITNYELRITNDEIVSPNYDLQLAPSSMVVSLVEGWRGEICHVAITDDEGRIVLYKAKDPSLHNWMALALAVRNQEISDFPLCNKSFNLSYCGNDL
ncbi:MAG: NADH-quinone oxidoreductase subunit C [Bacteroidetes bacterium]|nr:NADH-quinone oxidoreductase subunit C [Bacteroidota bacterium]